MSSPSSWSSWTKPCPRRHPNGDWTGSWACARHRSRSAWLRKGAPLNCGWWLCLPWKPRCPRSIRGPGPRWVSARKGRSLGEIRRLPSAYARSVGRALWEARLVDPSGGRSRFAKRDGQSHQDLLGVPPLVEVQESPGLHVPEGQQLSRVSSETRWPIRRGPDQRSMLTRRPDLKSDDRRQSRACPKGLFPSSPQRPATTKNGPQGTQEEAKRPQAGGRGWSG